MIALISAKVTGRERAGQVGGPHLLVVHIWSAARPVQHDLENFRPVLLALVIEALVRDLTVLPTARCDLLQLYTLAAFKRDIVLPL